MGEGLLTRDPQTMELKPLLAESWKNLNPNTWEIKLRRGVKFHNGEDFNADERQVHRRARHRVEAQYAGQAHVAAVLRPGRPHRRSLHRAHHHQGPGPDGAEPARRRVHVHGARQGPGRVQGQVRHRPLHRHRPVPPRRVRRGRPRRGRGQSRLLGAEAAVAAHRVAGHSRRGDAPGRAAAGRRGRDAEPPLPARAQCRVGSEPAPVHRARARSPTASCSMRASRRPSRTGACGRR